MSWLYRLQQRLSITKNEALTLLSLSLFLILGSVGRYACRQVRPVSADYYAEMDSLFAERSAAVLGNAEAAGRRQNSADDRIPPRVDQKQDLESEDSTVKRKAPIPLNIDLNRATLEELQQLPRVGPRTAERIVAFREAYGSFRSVDELLSVSGIGPKTLKQLRPHVYVTID